MKLICYDIGSYTLKKAEYIEDKNHIREISWQEFHVKGPSFDQPTQPESSIDEESENQEEIEQADQHSWLDEVVDIFLKEKNQWSMTDKVILILPEDFSTSRYLELPVNSKKKAMQILPFQLEDSIPFSMSQVHYQASYHPNKASTEVLVNIIGPNDLESLYERLDRHQIYFDLITTNIGILSGLNSTKNISQRNFGTDNFAIIDIGHLGTSCFFFNDGRLIANHNSISSGALLTENLSDSYNISYQEAEEYKHNEAFFLTSSEQESADKDEKVFALFMERTFSNLITDFSRWHLGYRTKTNVAVDKVYFVGGSSKIQNLTPFFQEHFEVHCEILDLHNSKIKLKNPSHISSLAACVIFEKQRPLNFLTGKFKARKSSIIPLNSSFKLFNRNLFLSSIICFFVLVDLLLNIYSSSKFEKSYKNKLIKNKINITKKQRPTFQKKPERLVPVLAKKIKSINNIKESINSVNNHNASKSLNAIFKIIGNSEFNINDLSYDNDLKVILNGKSSFDSIIQKIESHFNLIEKKEINKNQIELLLESR
mgnify:CR=1 FL=1|tara:strand:- start:6657 stop:8279 length:1623 start_codon:yes stop_codon:yes gene_type:complete